MEDILYNPVYQALLTGDAHLSFGNETVKYFDPEVSPFAGFHQDNSRGFDELYNKLSPGREILYATPLMMKEPGGWEVLVEIKGLQFVFDMEWKSVELSINPVPLGNKNIEEMVQLAALTKPGPFGPRTIEFGHYHGIFAGGRLAAMTGQRLHVAHYSEISAVCTHPDHLGKGYAASLIRHQLNLIHSQGQRAFLHVREDNERAIALYHRLGFKINRVMNFYFMKRRQ